MTTPPGQSSQPGKGVIGTAGEAIGDTVLFPFRAFGEAFNPSD